MKKLSRKASEFIGEQKHKVGDKYVQEKNSKCRSFPLSFHDVITLVM